MELKDRILNIINELIQFQEDKKQELLEYVFESDLLSLQKIMEYKKNINNTYELIHTIDRFLNNDFKE